MSSIITWHPTFACFHAPYEWGTFVEDVHRFGRLVRKELKPGIKNLVIRPKLTTLERIAYASDFVAVDIETGPLTREAPWTGKDPTRATLRTVGIGNEWEGASVVWREARPEVLQFLKDLLGDPRVLKIFHNGPWFDLRVLARYGVPVRNYLDTRDMRRAVSTTSKLSLRYLASLYNDTNNWKAGDDEADAKGVVFTDKMDRLCRYNAQDCVETARVFNAVRNEKEWDDARVVRLHEVHAKVSQIAARMHTVGMHVNTTWRQFMIHCISQAVVEALEKLHAAVGQKAFRPTDHGMRALIYKRHAKPGIKGFDLPDPLNPKMYTNELMNTISVAEPSLLLLLISGECPPELVRIIDLWWEVQASRKRLQMLTSHLIDEAIGADGRLRPGWNSCGTDTMRFACSEPNVMNFEQLLRHMFGPPEGFVWVHADKAQLELRVMAAVAEDDVLERALATGDVYAFNALEWFGAQMEPGTTVKDVKKKYNGLRQASKINHLSRQYGAGLGTCHANALKSDRSFTFSRVRELVRRWDATYPRTVAYWGEETARVMAQGYSEGRILGGRRYYPQPPELSDISNFPIQRTAGEMMNLELIELVERLHAKKLKAQVVVQLHDAFDVECPESEEAAVREVMHEVMDRSWEIEGKMHPFPVEIKVARPETTWAAV